MIAFSPAQEANDGTQAPSTKFFEMKNTSAIPCSRKPTPPTFLTLP
nr:MAG TPA: hypothetical protein [Caudoviricetes sp.]